MDRVGYSIAEVRGLLDNYALLEAGEMPARSEEVIESRARRRSKHRAKFEIPKILQSDLDRALQHLSPTATFVIVACDIDGWELQKCAFWLGKTQRQVEELEREAVEAMARYLSQ